MKTILDTFHPLIRTWFTSNFSKPTDIQEQSWPKIAAGENVLITAPTGSGKTLTAFLWAINQLVSNHWPSGQTKVLYVSPLKALNNDIRRNLSKPLAEIRQVFEEAEEPLPEIRAFTRSGDTSQADRRRMLRHPPEILITTPESLNLMLSSQTGQAVLNSLSTVILDEIHAVVGEKRGVHLMTAVDRLVRLSGEFQRISLSATVKPLEKVAAFVGGYTMSGGLHDPRFHPRPVSIVQSKTRKQYEIKVTFPEDATQKEMEDSVWDALAKEFQTIVDNNRSTLLFANSRKLSEKLTYKINQGAKESLAYAHHGSLSKEIREEVERKLKKGELKAIVATSSLEMGIDIGHLDEVVLIQSPPSVSSAIQRVGRAGHQVGETSRGTIFPSHAQDFICAAVLSKAIGDQDIEAIEPILGPLDVLAQIIISMVGHETWDIDDLYRWIKTSYSYRQLERHQFDLVLNMLAGRYADSRIRELKPRISIDRLDNTVVAKKGALMAVYMAGGTIPDRGYFQLRHQETGARIGELDEEYVWEAKIGQIATIGTQNWKIQRITHNDVFATPVGSRIMDLPFWKSEEYGRDFHFSQQISTFLENANEQMENQAFMKELETNYHMSTVASGELLAFLNRQKTETESELPHRHHILLEYVKSGPDGAPGSQLVIHTLWGGKLNRPFALALDAAWEERFGERLEIFPGNDSVILQLAHDLPPEELLSMISSANVESYLRKRLEGSGFFGARFRECAGRALLITRNKINQRMPLWMTRLRSQKLLEGVLQYDDFPILLETWRTCLQDEFDLENLRVVLGELQSGEISWSVTHSNRPSPFAAGMTWNQIDKYMYQVDQPASAPSSLNGNLIREVVFSPGLRPSISTNLIKAYEEKRQRLSPGYAPQTSRDLVDWVKERIAIPLPEWQQLLEAIQRDQESNLDEILLKASPKLLKLTPKESSHALIVSLENYQKILQAWYPSKKKIEIETIDGDPSPSALPETGPLVDEEFPEILISEWFQFYGPRTAEFILSTLGIERPFLLTILDSLIEARKLISGDLISQSGTTEICDSENFETLLRMSRSDAQPEFKALEIKFLPLFLAQIQGLTKRKDSIEDLFQSIEQLICLPCPAENWESDIFPARLTPYRPSLLDSIIQEGDLRWIGSEKQKISFCFEPDLDLIGQETRNNEENGQTAPKELVPESGSKYDLISLQEVTGLPSQKLLEDLWQQVWEGKLSNDNISALRKGIDSRFEFKQPIAPKPLQQRRGRAGSRKGGFSKWKGSQPYVGNWFRVSYPSPPLDLLEKEELKKDRVRLLLDRYGILFRELLQRESPEFRWAGLFRTLRLMELSGEILAGYFFEGIPGPQFISHKAFRFLQGKLPTDTIYWMSATDPASICGLPIDSIKGEYPRKLQSNQLAFKGADLKMISEKNGTRLIFNTDADDPENQEFLAPLKHLLYRQFNPLKQISVETINGEPAPKSPYLDCLKTAFELLLEPKKITLYRKL